MIFCTNCVAVVRKKAGLSAESAKPVARRGRGSRIGAAIAAAGITPPDSIIADGELHRFASNGEAIGPEVQVNSFTGGSQSWAQVAALSTGGYVITWQDDTNDGSGYGTYGQRFDASGGALGEQFLINTTITSTQ